MRRQGAEVMDVEIESAKELNAFKSGVLRYEFKRDLNHYLSTLQPGFPIRTLADVIAFNIKANALKYGQALALASEATDLEAGKATYLADRARDLRLSRDEGIDLVMRRHHLDALLFPSNFGASMPAKAGYPSVIVPGGYLENGAPFGVTFSGLAWSEPILLRLAYSFEQATHYRRPPSSAPAR
jgi:amidase